VIDISDPSAPVEVAHYQPDGTVAMSSYWYRGMVLVADMARGLDIVELDPSVTEPIDARSTP
jgi:hypothetical protein